MTKRSCTPLTQAARVLDSHPAALRKTINRFGIFERDGRQRVIPNDVLKLFRRTKAVSGYLYPAWVRTHDDLIAAAAQIPASVERLGADPLPPRQCKKPKRHEKREPAANEAVDHKWDCHGNEAPPIWEGAE
jgi:hypothetical protein